MSDSKSKPNKNLRTVLVVLLIILGSFGLCASGVFVKAVNDRSDYGEIIDRTEIVLLQKTEVTRYYHDMSWRHNDEIMDIMFHMTPAELMQAFTAADTWMPNMRALLDGEGDTVVITAEQVNGLSNMLLLVAGRGSPALHDDIIQEMDRLHLSDFIGMTMTQAWVHLHEVWGISNPPSPTVPKYSYLPTLVPTPGPYSIRTPQATLEGGGYASFWAEYRDPDDGYGLVYPADWVLRSEPDVANVNQGITICNNDLEDYYQANNAGICISIGEFAGIDPALTLSQAACEIFNNQYFDKECVITTFFAETSDRPAHLEIQIPPGEGSTSKTELEYIFRNPVGKLIIFYTNFEINQTSEAQAMVDSFVFGEDTPIIAPAFEPSKKISFKGK
jgi:hypothetical protein